MGIESSMRSPLNLYWRGFWDQALWLYIAREEIRAKGAPKDTPPDNVYFKPRVGIHSDTPEVIRQAVLFEENGKVIPRKREEGQSWEWLLRRSEFIKSFLLKIKPLTVIKEPVVDYYLKYLDDKLERMALQKQLKYVSPEEKLRRIESEQGFFDGLEALKAKLFTDVYTPNSETLAGMIDANGGIGARQSTHHRSPGGHPEFRVYVAIPTPHPGVAAGLKRLYGGYWGSFDNSQSESTEGELNPGEEKRIENRWETTSNDTTLELLRSVLPNLVVQKENASLAIALLEELASSDKRKVPGNAKAKREIDERRLRMLLDIRQPTKPLSAP